MDHGLIIAAIDGEIGRLQEARALLSGAGAAPANTEQPTPTANTGRQRKLSPAARRRIAEAQKKRWAAVKGAQTTSANKGATADNTSRKKSSKRRRLSPAARKRIAEAQKKRWAAVKAAKSTSAKKAAKKAPAKKAAKRVPVKKAAAARKAPTKGGTKAQRKNAVKKAPARSILKAPAATAKNPLAQNNATAAVTETTPA